MDDRKKHVQARFSQYAQGYVQSAVFSQGADLGRLVALAAPQPDWLALDIATGGGHTALRFAPLARHIVAADLTTGMLRAAREHITGQGASNISYTVADAEDLPFPSGHFDLVICRIAPHHFSDCFRFVQECARVLKPDGLLLVEDHLAPDDERAARYIDSFERLRDPSHVRTYAGYEWRGMLLDAGLTVDHEELFSMTGTKLMPWAQRQGCTPDVIERLQVLLVQAPQAVADWLHPQCAGSTDAAFDHHFIIILGRKPTA
jgi:ubiquinone/menaquinone biosynthesis C-methylase UbiE